MPPYCSTSFLDYLLSGQSHQPLSLSCANVQCDVQGCNFWKLIGVLRERNRCSRYHQNPSGYIFHIIFGPLASQHCGCSTEHWGCSDTPKEISYTYMAMCNVDTASYRHQWRIHGGREGPRTLPWLQAESCFSSSGASLLVTSVSVSGYSLVWSPRCVLVNEQWICGA